MKNNIPTVWTALQLALVVTFITLIPFDADAASVGNILCKASDIFRDTSLGRGLSTLAVLAIGCGALLGKVSWGMAILCAVGIAVIHNGYFLVQYLGVGTPGGTCV